jgi:hypothetical protein
MKRKVLSPLVILILLMAFIAPVSSQSVSDVQKSLIVNGKPVENVMTVAPGDVLNFKATASFTYHGPSVSPEVTVDGDIYLSQGGAVISHVPISRNLGQFSLTDGQTVAIDTSSVGGDIAFTVPTTVQGTCVLKMIATIHADVKVLGQTVASAPPQTESVVVVLDVVSPTTTPSGEATVTPTPAPTPAPETLHTIEVNSGTTSTRADGSLNLQSRNITTQVTNETGTTTDVGASFNVILSSTSGGNEISSYVTDHPTDTAGTQFMLTAALGGSDISDIAFVLVVEHPTMVNGEQIKNAVITMKVSQAWVTAHGGIDTIQILRYSDGVAEALDTHYVGLDAANPSLMVFQALSPNGLSEFALAALTRLPVSTHENVAPGASVNMGLIIGAGVAALVVLLLIIGGVWMILKKRKANKKQ